MWISFGGSIPFQAQGYRFHVLLGTDASTLTEGAQARISGVPVGRVAKVSRTRGRIDATIELQQRYAPIASNVRVILRTKTLLGEPFIELTPGDRNVRKLPDGGTLPVSQVQSAEGIDQLLSAFDAPTRRDLKRFLGDVSTALDGRAPDLSATLGNAAPTSEQLDRLLTMVDREAPAVQTLVRNAGATLRAIAAHPDDLRGVVTSGEQVFAATAARDRELTATIRALPPFLAQLRPTLRAVEATAIDAAPTLQALRPVAPLFKPGVQAASQLIPQFVPVARELGRVIDASRRGLPALTRVIDASRPLTAILNPTGSGIGPAVSLLLPAADLLDAYKREVVTSFANFGAATQGYNVQPDGSKLHYLRVLPPIGNEAAVGATQRLPSNRHNPYFAPGALNNLPKGALHAFDCRNLSNPAGLPVLGSGAPPCLVQAPWTFRGATRAFPHVAPGGP